MTGTPQEQTEQYREQQITHCHPRQQVTLTAGNDHRQRHDHDQQLADHAERHVRPVADRIEADHEVRVTEGQDEYRGDLDDQPVARSEEHTSELQSLMRISYAVFCWKKKHKTQEAKKT